MLRSKERCATRSMLAAQQPHLLLALSSCRQGLGVQQGVQVAARACAGPARGPQLRRLLRPHAHLLLHLLLLAQWLVLMQQQLLLWGHGQGVGLSSVGAAARQAGGAWLSKCPQGRLAGQTRGCNPGGGIRVHCLPQAWVLAHGRAAAVSTAKLCWGPVHQSWAAGRCWPGVG